MKTYATIGCILLVLAAPLAQAKGRAAANAQRPGSNDSASYLDREGGSNTGNGGFGDTLSGAGSSIPPMHPSAWCGSVYGYLQATLDSTAMTGNFSEKRGILAAGIQEILSAYQGGDLPYQTLTYSLLSTIRQVDLAFPRQGADDSETELSHEAAYTALVHLAQDAQVVSSMFDQQYFKPYFEQWQTSACRRGCSRLISPSLQLYTDGIGAVRQVLSDLFSNADPEAPWRGSVLDAMGKTRWELTALVQILGWVETTLANNIFNRQFTCLISQVKIVRLQLDNHLKGLNPIPGTRGRSTHEQDEIVRKYVETSLRRVLQVLQDYDVQSMRCAHRP